jgi:uncharacterized protein (DUF362 family)
MAEKQVDTERREFLKRTGGAVALAAVTAGTGLFFHGRDLFRYEKPVAVRRDFTVPNDPKLPRLSLARNEDHARALAAALTAVGGIDRFVKAGERVTIKPNVGWDRTPAQAANTNPLLVTELVRLCLGAGASEVIVTDVTCNDPRNCFIRSGIREAAEAAGASVKLPADEHFVTTEINGELLTSWPVLRWFLETDRVINVPIVKQHSLSSCTIGMKNLYGILGGRRHQLHQKIDQSIVDLAAFCRPTLTVVDATRVLMRHGPQGGSLDDVSHEHTVMCALDQVAADARGAEFLGLSGDRVGHILLAEKAGLGLVDYRAAGYQEVG